MLFDGCLCLFYGNKVPSAPNQNQRSIEATGSDYYPGNVSSVRSTPGKFSFRITSAGQKRMRKTPEIKREFLAIMIKPRTEKQFISPPCRGGRILAYFVLKKVASSTSLLITQFFKYLPLIFLCIFLYFMFLSRTSYLCSFLSQSSF